jgi:hypothetical protein
MATYTYTNDIPFSSHDPSVDQPDMQINTNSISSIISEDHYSFGQNTPGGDNANGVHKQVRLPSIAAIPAGLLTQSSTLYSKQTNGSQLYFTNGQSLNEYQMTRSDNTNFSTFGNFTNYSPVVANQFGGWSFLPGGLILMYGRMKSTGNSTVVVFPFAFPTAIFSLVTGRGNSTSSTTYGTAPVSTSGFTFNSDSNSVGVTFFWQAIGN